MGVKDLNVKNTIQPHCGEKDGVNKLVDIKSIDKPSCGTCTANAIHIARLSPEALDAAASAIAAVALEDPRAKGLVRKATVLMFGGAKGVFNSTLQQLHKNVKKAFFYAEKRGGKYVLSCFPFLGRCFDLRCNKSW